jgi:hypothetical protein
MLLERRAGELAAAAKLPLDALDLGFDNWERGSRARVGISPDAEPDPVTSAAVASALGL